MGSEGNDGGAAGRGRGGNVVEGGGANDGGVVRLTVKKDGELQRKDDRGQRGRGAEMKGVHWRVNAEGADSEGAGTV